MSAKIRKFTPHLKILATSRPKVCKVLLKSASGDLIKCLCECVLNVIKGNVPLTPAQKRRLKRHKKDLRFLAKRNSSLTKKKKVLQKGGLLPAVLAPILGTILPAIGGAIGNLIGNIKKKR